MPELTVCPPRYGAKICSYDQLIDHVVKAHNSTCQICGAKLNSKEPLLQHNREKHAVKA